MDPLMQEGVSSTARPLPPAGQSMAGGNRVRWSRRMVLAVAVVLCYLGSRSALADVHGFSEAAFGPKLRDDPNHANGFNLLEGRLQLQAAYFVEKPAWLSRWGMELAGKADVLLDGYDSKVHLLMREGYVALRPTSFMDLKAGRQILSWGTGTYLFVNDLFPKDYVSFFVGRDEEYLKCPSDALRVSLFPGPLSIDFVWIPVTAPDTEISGRRIAFYDPLAGRLVGDDSSRRIVEKREGVGRSEIALRLYGNVGRFEVALYGFRGFFKEPLGIADPLENVVFYPRLNVYGGSLRGPLLGGIANVEAAVYDSREDPSGVDWRVENSSWRCLLGYNRQLGGQLEAEAQYLLEAMLDYDAYVASLPEGGPRSDRLHHLFAATVKKHLRGDTLELGLALFYDPAGADVYARPSFQYAATDRWKLTAGANVFRGTLPSGTFGQLESNSNLFVRLRYSF